MSECDETLPLTMGRYQIVRRIPGGGMTEVYLARVSGSFGIERPLVLKALPPVHGSAAEARFLEEAAISLSLSHGNITTTFETGRSEDGRAFLVMEYVHGSSLRQLLDLGPLPAPLAVFVAREIARALRYTHTFADLQGRAAPIVHLDVTPENVLVSRAGHVKLTDFGIARAVGQAAGETVFGKPSYTAPEILARGRGGPASDLWSLCCVLYEMLVGRAPHRGEDRDATIANVRSGVMPPPPSAGCELPEEVAGEVDRLVSLLFEPDVEKRLADAALVERILTGALTRVEPLPTEADVSALMEARFPAAESGQRHRLRAELQAAGRATDGAEDTDALLREETIPLFSGAGGHVAAAAEGRPPARSRRRLGAMFFSAVLAVAASLFLVFGPRAWAPTKEPSPLHVVSDSPDAQAVEIDGGLIDPGPGDTTAPAGAEPEQGTGSLEPGEPASASSGSGAEGQSSPPSPDASGSAPRVENRPNPRGPEELGTPATRESAEREPAEPDRDDASVPEPDDAGTPDEAVPAPRPASLQINAYPYARVVLGDDIELGTTPLRDVLLAPGTHRLRFFNPELGLAREMEIELAEGEERVLGVRLDR